MACQQHSQQIPRLSAQAKKHARPYFKINCFDKSNKPSIRDKAETT
jgi:hypothetical protein